MNRFVIITIALIVIQIIAGVVVTHSLFGPLVGVINDLTVDSSTQKQTQNSAQEINMEGNTAAVAGALIATLLSSAGTLAVSINRVKARTQKKWAWILLIIYSTFSILSSIEGLFISSHFFAMYRDLMPACIPGIWYMG